MKKIMVLSLMLCLSSSLFAMQPAAQGWDRSYERNWSGRCFLLLAASFSCTAVAQELGLSSPMTIHDHTVPPLCMSMVCGLVGLTQANSFDHDPDHSYCCACLRAACGRRAGAQAPGVQKME